MSDAGLYLDTATRVGDDLGREAVFARALISAKDSNSSSTLSAEGTSTAEDWDILFEYSLQKAEDLAVLAPSSTKEDQTVVVAPNRKDM